MVQRIAIKVAYHAAVGADKMMMAIRVCIEPGSIPHGTHAGYHTFVLQHL